MVVDLADLRTVKGAVEGFLAREGRLDVLVHNAAVMTPPAGSKDKLVSVSVFPIVIFVWCRADGGCNRATISKSERTAWRRIS